MSGYEKDLSRKIVRHVAFCVEELAFMKRATKEERRYLLSLFREGSKKNRIKIYNAGALMAVAMICNDLINPLIVAHLLGDIAGKKVITSLDPYIPFIIALIFVEIVTFMSRRLGSYLEERFDALSRREIIMIIFSRLLEHPAHFHQSRFVGKTITLISKTSDAFGRTSALFFFHIVPITVSIIGTGVILIPRVPLYFSIVILVSVLYLVVISKLLPRQMQLSSQASEVSSKMYGVMSDAVSNIGAVKAESSEELENENIGQIADDWLIINKRFARHVLIRDGILSASVIRSLRVLCILFALIAAVGHGKDVSGLYLAATLTLIYMGHLWDFSDALYDLTTFYGDAAPIVPMLMAQPDIEDKKNAHVLERVSGAIELNGVGFSYPNTERDVFNDLSLSIRAGERVGLVGRSGAGKSTLVKLIMRFIDVTDGSISVDGIDVRDVTQDSLRNNISYVSQEPVLFHRSVLENISYAMDDVTKQEIDEVLTRSHSNEFIAELPLGLESVVGERGVNLSGGQRQRLAIARAMLKNAPILILDEATSALDSESEGYVQSAFAELMKDRTTLVIAHRLSTLLNMDRIIVFDEGAIVEQGTHDELVAHGGIYAGLWQHQAGGFLGGQ